MAEINCKKLMTEMAEDLKTADSEAEIEVLEWAIKFLNAYDQNGVIGDFWSDLKNNMTKSRMRLAPTFKRKNINAEDYMRELNQILKKYESKD